MKKRLLFDIQYIWRNEYLRIMKEPGVLIIFFAATLLYPVLYGTVYKNEVVRKVPVAVIDQDNSSLSRQFIQTLDATPEVNINYKCHNLEEAKTLFYQHKVHGILLIPESFTKDINVGKQTPISTYLDMSSFVYYKSMMTSFSLVSKYFGIGIQYKNLVAHGYTEQQAKSAINPIPYSGVALFNSGGGFSSFLLPGIFILILYQTMMLGINMLAGVEWEDGKASKWKPIKNRFQGTIRIIVGKSLCYFSLYIVFAVWVLGFIPLVFNLPHIGNPLTLALFLLPFLLSTIFLAMTLSVCMRNMESAFLLLLFSTLPLLFLAGASWPQTNIPEFWKLFSYLFPSTHGIQGYIRINTMDANLSEVSKEYFFLWLQAGIYFVTAWCSYRWIIKKNEKI